jgi:hypothetical protein
MRRTTLAIQNGYPFDGVASIAEATTRSGQCVAGEASGQEGPHVGILGRTQISQRTLEMDPSILEHYEFDLARCTWFRKSNEPSLTWDRIAAG